MKDHDTYLRQIRAEGYIVTRRLRSRHLLIYGPCGCLVTTASGNGGSDFRSLRNLRAQIHRHTCREDTHADLSVG